MDWLVDTLKSQYDLKRHMLELDSKKGVESLEQVVEDGHGIEWECDPKRAKTLII